MIHYLDENVIKFINEKTLELTNEISRHHVLHYGDLRLVIDFVMERFGDDIKQKALGLLCFSHCVASFPRWESSYIIGIDASIFIDE